ncbi:MAG: hypothetical protein MUE56_00635 [Ignavibacteria bacterium]|jgi:hypothetical protein|nr:hypothetical protein [Ignavibacteria bacterium]
MKNLPVFVIFIFVCNACYPQDNSGDYTKSNYEIFYNMCSDGMAVADDFMTEYGKEITVAVSVSGTKEIKKFFTGILKQKFGSYRFLYSGRPDSSYYLLNIEDADLTLRYTDIVTKNVFSDDYIKRYLKSSFKIRFLNEKGELLKEKTFSKEYRDEINFVSLESAERSDYSFTKSAVPEKPFMSKIFVPAIVVAVSALTIILFFAIRSK